ncbi:hypothetical protein LSH36_143g04024, partial [Paralvinella palmiformis]
TDAHGGVLLVIKKDLNSRDVNLKKDANRVAPDTEIVFEKFKNKKKGSILLGCCYRPPSSDLSYANSLTNSIRSLTQPNPSSIVSTGGDFNLPDIQWEDSNGHSNTKSINETFLTTFQDLSL